MANVTTQTVLKWVQAAAYIAGPALIAYNLSAVRVAKAGYYFVDKNQLWLAIGVALYTLSIVLRNWRR